MSNIVVQPVQTKSDQRTFVDFPWTLYADDPNWVPPLRDNQRRLLGYKHHPFHEIAEVQTFLARRNGQVCGRVAAILNHAHNKTYNERRGFFGFFESINDQQVADALFAAVADWFAQRGIRAIRGPTNPSMNYECALLVEGFHSPPTFMMTYNFPYYRQLIEGCGFRKTHDMFAFAGKRDQLPELEQRLGPLIEQARQRSHATLRHLNRKRFMQDVEMFLDLYNRSMVTTWGFVPLSKNELRQLAGELRHLLIPELAIAAEADGRPVGVILGLADYNPCIKKIDGRLLPFGFLRLLWYKRQVRRIRVISINVLPEYQRWGLGLVLMAALVPKGLEMGLQEAEFSWVSEENDLAVMGLKKGGAVLDKRYRMYDLHPDAATAG